MQLKQTIIIRKDLKLQRGKEIAQGSHAAMEFLCQKLKRTIANGSHGYHCIELTEIEEMWLDGNFAKVCLQVNSEAELLEIHNAAKASGLESHLIQDSGKTVFHGVPTYTCLAIGPDTAEKIDPITKHLKLY